MILPVALTCGEPAGVSIELAARAWSRLTPRLLFFLVADTRHVQAHRLPIPVERISSPAYCSEAMPFGLPVIHHEFPRPIAPGRPDAANAPAIVEVVDRAVNWCKNGAAAAICTGPLAKHVFAAAGRPGVSGHTEYIASLCGVDQPVMMLASRSLRVVPATTHIPLREVSASLTERNLSSIIRTCAHALAQDLGIAAPRIAVMGLNPHAGEGGLLGDEEQLTIIPAIAAACQQGLNVTGPHSADTMFCAERLREFDLAVCMYHDQALIPIKTLAFHEAVNTTLGLPIVRTSPDHGTALDIAGTGRARPDSLIAALQLAHRIAATRRRRGG